MTQEPIGIKIILLLILTFLTAGLAETIPPSDPRFSFYEELGYDPQRQFEIYYEDRGPEVVEVLTYIRGLESNDPAYSLSSLATPYYQNLRFFELPMPVDIRNRLESLLVKRVSQRDTEALRALIYEPQLVEELEESVLMMLRSESKSEVLSALSAASARKDLFSSEVAELESHVDDEIALEAIIINVEDRNELPTDKHEIVLRNLFSRSRAHLAVQVLREYERTALELLPSIEKRLGESDVTAAQRESVEYALDLIWPRGIPDTATVRP